MKTVDIGSTRLGYVRRGAGAPLLLIHGYPLDHSTWGPVADHLASDFDVVMPDLRGFGSSSPVKEPYSMDDMAADLAGLLDHLGIGQAFIAGHSMGGYVALAFLRNHGARVLGLGLVSSQVAADPEDRKAGRYETAVDVAANGTDAVVEGLVLKLSPNPAVQEAVRALMRKQSADGIVGALKAMAERRESSDLLAGLKAPLVLIHGDADALIPVDRARDMKATVPAAILVEMPGVGHMPMLEVPPQTAAALRRLSE
jgi:pimeloyl-ACP methyl ester carboxylesterase